MDPLGEIPIGNQKKESESPSSESPPSEGQNASPPDGSSNQSPPSEDQSSSPSGSDSPPPPQDEQSSGSPPDNSNSSPSSDPPSTNSPSSDSESPPPPPSENSEPSGSNSSPPPPEDSNSSPSNSEPSPPPPSEERPPSGKPPSESPKSNKDSPPAETRSPPSENQQAPPTEHQRDSPPSRDHPPSSEGRPSKPSVLTPPGSHTSELSPPTRSTHSSSTSISSSSTSPTKSNSDNSTATIAGATVAGVLIIALVALCFVISRKKKRRGKAYYDPYGPPPNNYSMNADGYYYGQHSQQHPLPHSQQHSAPHSQQHSVGMPGYSGEYYSGQPPAPAGINSYGSYKGPDSGVIAGSQSCFTYEELMGITEGFARQNVIGEGGFGAVYKGFLPDGRAVAVKQLKAGSGQGEREFRAEVEIISRVHHRHLVSLVGYCIAENQRLLVYEFVPNNTLEHHLHAQGVPVMDWSKRLKIAIGAARGLAYLHEDCHPKIIHRDIKSANILIDDVYEAQVADFGLAKLSNDTHTHVSTRVMGTFGYMAPEYASSGKLTDRSDVFSFGVVLLELVTGRKPVDPNQPLGDESLVEWARPVVAHALETGDFSELVDPRLGKRYVESEMFRMAETAAACVRHSAPKRPRMVQVLRALDTDGDMPDISNGVKVGQSTIFEVNQHNSDLQKFRMMAFGSDDSSEYNMYSGQMKSKEMVPPRPPSSGSVDFPSGESETRPINPRRSDRYK